MEVIFYLYLVYQTKEKVAGPATFQILEYISGSPPKFMGEELEPQGYYVILLYVAVNSCTIHFKSEKIIQINH